MNPSLWGPSLWASLIYIVLNYPEKDPKTEDMQVFFDYFENLGAVLPCNICRIHYQNDFPNHLPQLDNRLALFDWLVGLHNRCNPKNKFNRNQFLQRYAPKCQGMLSQNKNISRNVKGISNQSVPKSQVQRKLNKQKNRALRKIEVAKRRK